MKSLQLRKELDILGYSGLYSPDVRLKKTCRWCNLYFGQGFDSPHLHKLGGAMVSTGYKEHD